MESGFQSGTEITFNCIVSAANERTTWKIICEDGAWVGRSLNCGKFIFIFHSDFNMHLFCVNSQWNMYFSK